MVSARELWRALWRRAPRRLRFTAAGRTIVLIALATGFAAINTGNNLLFLGWGLVLSAIVISGILSEGTLRSISLEVEPPAYARAGEPAALPVRVRNTANRLSAFGLETRVELRTAGGAFSAAAPFLMRVPARSDHEALARCELPRRGAYRLHAASVQTAYPFGFFVKARPFTFEPARRFWVLPPAVDVSDVALAILSRSDQTSSHMPGHGEDYFAMRYFRDGDDPRRIKWRRAAKTGRLVVVEHEASAGHDVVIELCLPVGGKAGDDAVEHAISVAGSLAEMLIAAGLRVGLRAPGALLMPAAGARQASLTLLTLAQLEPSAALPPSLPLDGTSLVCVRAAAAAAPAGADFVVDAPSVRPPLGGTRA